MESSECVRVAVNIRPLITPELLIGCTDIITVVPGEPQVLNQPFSLSVLISLHLDFIYKYKYK
jgi:hypothetical protein